MRRRALLIPALVAVAGIVVLVGVGAYIERWSARPLPISESVEFVLPPGTAFSQLGEKLEAAGVVDAWLLGLRARQRGVQGQVQSGEYRIEPGETADGLLDRLVAGAVLMHRFRIEEGSTVARLLSRLGADDRLRFDLAGAAAADLLARLGLEPGHAEGRFFPDTYHVPRGYGASALLRRAEQQMAAVLAEAWASRREHSAYASPYEALIVASMVEKETAMQADRARVAGVFVRRLQRGMRLQSDPTVIYGLGDAFDGDLTRAHLAADGPYNTYRRFGLPPTPIALPGRAAIEAALHPDAGESLYFVSRGDGSSEFSATLAEHNAAVRRFQRSGGR